MNNHNLFYTALLINGKVKMAEYYPSFFFVFLRTEAKSRSTKAQKKNKGNIQPSLPNKLLQNNSTQARVASGAELDSLRVSASWIHNILTTVIKNVG